MSVDALAMRAAFSRAARARLSSRSAAARMRQLNKPNFKYVEIKKMAHTLNEMTPDMRNQFIPLILDWTSTNCGNISATFKEPGLKTTPAKRVSK